MTPSLLHGAPPSLRLAFLLSIAILLGGAGVLLLVERPGLAAEYFALEAPWEGRPLATSIGAPALADASQVGERLTAPVLFSVRWCGWWRVDRPGEHRFDLVADDGGYLSIDGEWVAEVKADAGAPVGRGAVHLEPGFHVIEVGHFQSGGDARLEIHWVAPGADPRSASPLPIDTLYAGRPLALRRLLRHLVPQWPRAVWQIVGAMLLATAVSLLAAVMRSLPFTVTRRFASWRQPQPRWARPAALALLVVVTFLVCFSHAGTVVGGDDTSYLHVSTINAENWYVNRYLHVYLLKLFTALSGGDPLVGVRSWWSFAMAVTVGSMAVAVASIGSGLQLRTLALVLFVLSAQPIVWGLIGAGFADFSAMMFVSVAVAAYLHGVARDRDRPPPRVEWHALAIGLLTAGAMRSKEVGAVLVLLPPLWAIGPGPRLDLRRLLSKLPYWAVGLGLGMLAVMALDGWILGDFFLTWDSGHRAFLRQMNFPPNVSLRKESWLDNLWHGAEMRSLWIGVLIAAVVAGIKRRSLELRLLHLLPIAYLGGLIVLYVRLPHPVSDRMLIPIVPVACLLVGLVPHYLGLDEIALRRMLRARALLPTTLVAAVVLVLAVPWQTGELAAESLLPAATLERFGWRPESFVLGVAVPVGVLLAGGGAALVAGSAMGRVLTVGLALLVAFGPGFEVVRRSLAEKRAVQTGRLLVYPWKTFREELIRRPASLVVLSADLRSHYRMTAATRTTLAKLVLGRQNIHVGLARDLPVEAPAAIASQNTYLAWLRQMPALAETATFGPSGFLVLVRPKEAAEIALRRPEATDALTPASASVADWIEALKFDRRVEAWSELASWILANPLGLDRGGHDDLISLDGTRLRAIFLYADGWTQRTRPAALVVDNRYSVELTQRLSLAIGDSTRRLPETVYIDDGERIETVRFDSADPITVELSPVAPYATRLFLIWSEGEWTPSAEDPRQLGVRVHPAPSP